MPCQPFARFVVSARRWLGIGLLALVAAADATEYPPLRVMTDYWPPFRIEGADGRISGLDMDLLAELEKRTGLRFEVHRAPWARGLASGGELLLSSMPSFVLGILLLLVFSFQLHWLPPTGSRGWKSLVLPILTLALPVAAVLAQVLRQELEEILEQPFIAMARARGLSEAGVRLGHALRHALTPLITLSGFVFAALLGGAVITENLFARQGIGRLMLNAVNDKDVPVVLGITLLAAAIYVLVNLAVDLLNALVDPRVSEA